MTGTLLALIPLFPLLGFLILGTGFRKLPRGFVSFAGPAAVIIPFILSLVLFLRMDPEVAVNADIFTWISSGSLTIPFSFLLDPLSAFMLMVVTGVGSIIHFYSVGYMHDDPGYNRFFAYMNLFVFSMLLLVLGSNYVVMFIGWEGVGLCSYLLIGFWFRNHEYNHAAKKAFIMNRIGDLGFLLGMFLMFTTFGSLNFKEVFAGATGFTTGSPVIVAITLLLFVGAVGKSAQIPLYTWLPDAMAGPTPVSALIHAATMVTAGVYLVARSNVLFAMAPLTMEVIAVTGLATALFAAVIAIWQNDIKKILAYSTISQLGYMFLALGTGAFTGAMFHLTTHAFFKALLFLGAGSVIHALGGEQDIRMMGGLSKRIKITYLTFLTGTVAIAGIPPLSGFFSKDEILLSAFGSSFPLWVLGVTGAFLTAFYMFRLLFLAFTGKYRGYDDHIHESPKVMTIPLILLALLSVFGGLINIPAIYGGGEWLNSWLGNVFAPAKAIMISHDYVPHLTEIAITAVTLAGVGIMIWLAAARFARKDDYTGPGENIIVRTVQNKFYVDEIYELLVIKPVMWFSKIFHDIFERSFLLKIFDGIGTVALKTGSVVRFIQTGNVGFYLFVMVFSIIALLVFNILF